MKNFAYPILTLLLPLALASPVHIHYRKSNQIFEHSKSDARNVYDGIENGVDGYKLYIGNGSVATGWPPMSQWVSFKIMFDDNISLMKMGCTSLGLPPGSDTTDLEISQIYDAIQIAALRTGVDHRFILAIMLQESLGCVRVYTTANANANPGLMQDHAGTHSCNRATKGMDESMVFPCPFDEIQGMIMDGVGGTNTGDGLAGYLNAVVDHLTVSGIASIDTTTSQIYYQAGRFYNSGSIDFADLAHAFSSRRCYASDIANRLTGWVFAPTTCRLDN